MSMRTIAVPLLGVSLMVVAGAHPPASGVPGAPIPGRLTWPLSQWTMTQAYGCTTLELEPSVSWCPSGHFHSGIDLAAPEGTVVRAAAAGVVSVVDSPGGYGLHIVIDHGGGVSTLYGHLESAWLRSGEQTEPGAVIGLVGSSGLSTGPHLHFEVRRDGRPVDPIPWLPAAT